MRTKRLSLMLAFVFIFSMLAPVKAAVQDPIKLWVNGDYVEEDVAPFIEDGRTFVPLRFVSEKLGLEVRWINEERKVLIFDTVESGQEEVNDGFVFIIDDMNIYNLEGFPIYDMDVATRIVNDRTFIPVRFVAEAFNMNVDWDNDNRTVIIGDGYEKPSPKEDVIASYLYGEEYANKSEDEKMEYELDIGNRLSKDIPPFTNKQVEAAIVWLTIHGDESTLRGWPLYMTFAWKGEYITIYGGPDGPRWPRTATQLRNSSCMADMISVDYYPNFDGTITVYRFPYHWHGFTDEENSRTAQKGLDNAKIVPLGTFSKEDIINVANKIYQHTEYQYYQPF